MEFGLKVLLSFIVGGAAVSAVVWTSEHLGTHIGGAIAGIPITISLSLVFICFTAGSGAARAASVIIPIVVLVGLLYAYIFTQVARSIDSSKDKHLKATAAAIVAWFIAAIIVRRVFAHATLTFIIPVALLGMIGVHYLFKNFRSSKPKKLEMPPGMYVVRFLIAGSVVAGAVIAARLLGPTWGGIVSSVPAIFSTSLYFLNKSQGCAFTEGFAKRLPLSCISVLVFIIILHTSLTRIPAALAFLIGISGSIAYTYALLSVNKPTVAVGQID